ncbi:hypothetical protein B0T25DRAFT_95629 [Lasiosphaeria hispida]|uniref:Uncharacterized protein n=1 Tax=Lasiosphaeria hispida TaxID=260671 RepID=A0AAJ0HQL4_9PEZI|nr:hypothetical protein B0T25DRAFT_95629 [Lasiosphaeria hispida]
MPLRRLLSRPQSLFQGPQLFRRSRPQLTPKCHARPRPQCQTRNNSTKPSTPPTPNGGSRNPNSSCGANKNPTTRAQRILSRLPPSLRKYTDRLRDAPLHHVVAFLILHEITAVLPLFGLFGVFHYTNLLPISYMMEHYGGYVDEGIGRFERYFKKKGWIGADEEREALAESSNEARQDEVLQLWESSNARYKIVVEVALAYAVTKALLPLRIAASVWATPWFARVLGGLRRFTRRKQ